MMELPLVWDLLPQANRLKDSDAISKVIILLTDGVNNSGMIHTYISRNCAKIWNTSIYYWCRY